MRTHFTTIALTLAATTLVASVALTSTRAEQAGDDVAIDPDDIGGVVTGPNGPEAGVWVIAETRDLPVRYIKSVVTDDRGRFVVPDLPRASYSVWARGYGLVDSDKATAKPGQRLAITAKVAPNEAAAAHYYPAIYWYSMLKIPPRGSVRRQEQHPRAADAEPVDHGDEEHRLHRLPSARAGVDAHDSEVARRRSPPARRRGSAACSRARPGSRCSDQLTGLGDVAFANYGDWTDRVAKGELPFAKPPRPQGVERNIVVTLRDWMNEKQYLHDLIASDRRNPDRERERPALRIARVQLGHAADSRSGREHGDDVQGAGARSGDAAQSRARACGRRSIRCSRRRTGAASASGRRASTTTTRCSGATADCGWPRPCAATTIRRGARPARIIRRRRRSRWIARSATSRCSIRRRRSTRSSRRATRTHHPQFGYDANDTLWTSGGGPVVGWLNTKMFDRDRRRGEVAGLDGADSRHQRQRQARRLHRARSADRSDEGPAHQLAVLRGDAESGRRIDLGLDARLSRARSCVSCPDRIRPRPRSPRSTTCRCPASARAARDIDSKGVVWVSLGSGHIGSFDRRKCKGPLNGPKATGDHCPEGWSFYKYPGPGLPGHRRQQRRVELLLVGRSAQHVRPRQRRADVDRQSERRHHRLRERPHGRAARAVSDRLLRQGLRRPHRRSEGRLEGQRPVGRQRRSHAVADRRRQGHQAARRALPAAAGSAGEVAARPRSLRSRERRRACGAAGLAARSLAARARSSPRGGRTLHDESAPCSKYCCAALMDSVSPSARAKSPARRSRAQRKRRAAGAGCAVRRAAPGAKRRLRPSRCAGTRHEGCTTGMGSAVGAAVCIWNRPVMRRTT